MIARLFDRIAKLLKDRRTFASRVVPAIVAAATAIVAMAAVDNLALLTSADRFVGDWEVAAIAPSEPQDSNIVIAAITEETLRQFPYRSPVDRAFIAELLGTLAARGPRAIGVDLLFDQPTEAAKDAALRKALNESKVPLVVSYTESPAVVTEKQRKFLADFVAPVLRGLATLATDQLDTVRWIYPGARGKDGRYIPGFARALAERVGVRSAPEQVPLAWHGRPSPDTAAFRAFPAHLVHLLPAAWFKDKVVLIGTDITLVDRHRTPYATVAEGGEGMLAGVVIQAHALAQLLEGRKPPAVGWTVNLLVAFAAALLGALLGMINLPLLPRVGAALVSVVLLWGVGALLFHHHGAMIGLIAPTLSLAASFWAMEALSGREARRQREFIQGAFSRYVSPKLVERLIRDPSKMSLEGERRVMTYLFTDVQDFTTMSEKVESKELARVLNAYLDGMTETVQKHDGMVDKFIGDAVFAIFNAPVDQPDHAERAVRCALDIDRFAESYHAEQQAKGIPFGHTRIGVHTGPAVIGNFGSRSRFDYTAQGDAVNTASRLEGLNKHFGTRISVSGATRALCKDIGFRQIASVVVKGKAEAVEVWEPLEAGDHRRHAFLARYSEAFAKLAERAPEALELFTALKAEEPDDPCVSLHLDRLQRGHHGVAIVMAEK